MAIKSFKWNKLIRDHIPNVMQAKNIVMHNKIMDKEEFIEKLKGKLHEECQEVIKSHTSEEFLEELADVLEVIHALSNALDFSIEKIEEKRIEKRQKKGGFEARIFSSHIDVDENNPDIDYFLSQSQKYPQICNTE